MPSREKIQVPFYPLTEEGLKEWYRKKYITAAGYILGILRVIRPPGAILSIPDVTKFCEEWEISRSAFYKTISVLKVNGDIEWEAIAGVKLRVPEKVVSLERESVSNRGHVSPMVDTESTDEDSQSPIVDTTSTTEDTDIYIDRACAQTIQTKTNSLQTEEALPEQQLFAEIHRIGYDWRKQPWMESATEFKPEIIQAVWQCNTQWYSLEGTKTPNLKKINDRLGNLAKQLKKLGLEAITAYRELQNYWTTAQAISNPEVEQAFNCAAIRQKQQQTRSSIEQALHKPKGGIF